MADVNLFSLEGAISMRVKFPVYDGETVAGQKTVTEKLAYVSGGTSDTAKIIINAITALYDEFELDANNTTVTYPQSITELVAEYVADEEYSILTPDSVNWKLSLTALSQTGAKDVNSIGYLHGSLTPAKVRLFDQLARNIVNLSDDTYSDLEADAIFKPYVGE